MTNFVDRVTQITAAWANQVDTTINAPSIASLSQVTIDADKLPYYSGPNTAGATAFPAFGRTIVACASASALAALLAASFDASGSATAAMTASMAYTDSVLALKANIASPTFTGIPAAPTAAVHTNTTQLATTAFVVAEIASTVPPPPDLSAYLTIASASATYQTIAGMSAYATLADPHFTGVPTAPTAAASTNTTQLATCAFVLSEVAAGVGVDLTPYATKASPTFTGIVTLPAVQSAAGIAGSTLTGRWTIIPNTSHDMTGYGAAGSVLAANILLRGSDTITVADGKQLDIISLWPVVTTSTTGIFTALNVQPLITTTSSSFHYGITSSITVDAGASGKVTGMYSRAIATGAYAGALVGHSIAVTSTASTPSSYCVNLSADGVGVGFGAYLSSNDASDCGWGYIIAGSVQIRNAAFAHYKFTGAHGYEPDLMRVYESDGTTLSFAISDDGCVEIAPATIRYDKLANVVGASVYVYPSSFTVATGKQYEGVSVRPADITLSGTAVFVGASISATLSSTAAGTSAVGIQAAVGNAGAGITYGNVVAVYGSAGHTGALVGAQATATMIATSASALLYDAVADGAAGTYVITAGYRVRGYAAGDKVLHAFNVDSTLVVTGAALYYNQRSGNTADFLTLYDNANSRNLFSVTSAGNVVFGATGQTMQQLIQGDFSNATIAYRTVFQTRAANANSSVAVIPNGSATTANWRAHSNSDLSAAGNYGALTQITTVTAIDANVVNAGTQGSLELRIGGTAKLTLSSTGTCTIAGDTTFSGDIVAIRGQTTTFPAANAAGILTNNGSGTLTWATVTGTSQSQEYTTGSGNFSVPAGVSLVYVTGVGAGGAGGGTLSSATTGAGGGGAGEHGIAIPVIVTPSSTVAYAVGAKGTGTSGGAGSAGGDTTFGSLTFKGGSGGTGANSRASGAGGGTGGGASTSSAVGPKGTLEAVCSFGGGAGGAGGSGTGGNGLAGAASTFAGGLAGSAASSQSGGGGGASTPWGQGGTGGNGGANGNNAAAGGYGAGGGGSGGKTTALTGGDGIGGYLLITWVA